MAGVKLNGTLKASGILEVIVSMVIILIVFGIAMAIFTQCSLHALTVKKLKARAILSSKALQLEQVLPADSQSFKVDDITITVAVNEYKRNLRKVVLNAYGTDQQIIDSVKFMAYDGK